MDSSATLNPSASSTWGDDWEFTYDDYVPNTVDPDWWFTIMIVCGCLVLNASLPLWIMLGKRLGFHAHLDKNNNSKAALWEVKSATESVSKDDVLIKQLDEARSVISGSSHYHSASQAPSSVAPSEHSGASGLLSRAGTHLGFHHSPGDMRGDDATVVSHSKSTFTEALLQARPRRTPVTRRRLKTKQIISTAHDGTTDDMSVSSVKKKLDVRMAAEFKRAEMDLLQDTPTTLTPNTTSSDVDMGNALDDSRSEAAPSILSKLDADAISVRDAVDARLEGHFPPEKPYTRNTSRSDACCQFLDRLMEAVDCDKEMKKFLALASHYSVQGIITEMLEIVEIAAIGHFMGVRAASAYIVVSTVTGFTGSISTGFYECCGVLIPQAKGARNDLLVGKYLQLSMLFYCLAILPSAVFWCFFTDDAVTWYKFDEETASMAQNYVYATLPGFITYGIDAILWEFVNTVGKEVYGTWFTIISSILHTSLIVGALAGGIGDLFYLGLLQTFIEIVFLFINFGILWYMGWMDPYWEGLSQTNGLRDWRAVRTVVNTAVPLSFSWVLTYGEWEIMTLFCRSMSDTGAEVAAWGLVGYLWNTFETLTNGLGDAAEVRIGFRMGAGQVRLAKVATDKALYVCFTMALYCAGLLFILAMYIPSWLTPDKTLQKMIFDIIPLVGFGSIWMVWGMLAWAVLGAQGRIRLATILEFFISWGIGAPIAAIFVYLFNYNIEGIIGALTISYTIGTNVYMYMLYTSDWERLSANVVAQNAAEGNTYNEFDWDELPDNIREAAVELGYDKHMWENDIENETDEKEWNELTDTERKAALLLGYTPATWDGIAEGDEDNSTGDSSSDGSEAWNNLSHEAQSAARILGYTKAIWDNDGSPPTEDLDWDELSPAEQEAAMTLGYDQKKWDGDEDAETASYVTPREAIPTIADDSSNSITIDRPAQKDLTSTTPKMGGYLDQIIASCSFDSTNGKSDHSNSSVTGSISNKISSILGISEGIPEAEEKSSNARSKTN